jgi:hypothetical protein
VVWAIAGEWLAPFLAYVDAQKKKKKNLNFFSFPYRWGSVQCMILKNPSIFPMIIMLI